MKTLKLFYVYDTIGGCAITNMIPMSNDLVAWVSFRDNFIQKKDSPYNYKALELVKFGEVNVDYNGEFKCCENVRDVVRYSGKEIMDLIQNELAARGIDDNLIDEDEN